MSKFAEILTTHKIQDDEILKVSHALETRTSEDRKLAFARRKSKLVGKKLVEAAMAKPKIGRAVTMKSVNEAKSGLKQTRLVRGKLTRAVNSLLKKRGQAEMLAVELFAEVPRKRGAVVLKKKSS